MRKQAINDGVRINLVSASMSGVCISNFRLLAMVGVLVISWSIASAAEPGPELVALVPSGIGLVAGMNFRHADAEQRHLLIPIPGKSVRDYDYFRSLCGADPAKSIDEVIFVADNLDRAGYEHTLLASGHFNPEILFRSALSRGAVQEYYRELRVLRVPPLSRERSDVNDFTWMVIVDSRVLLLGTPEYVRREVDRLLARSAPDPLLAEQFAAAQRSDVWWIILKPYEISLVREAFMSLNPVLAELLALPNYRVGVRYGRQAVFEYQIGILGNAEPVPATALASTERPQLDQFTFFSDVKPRSRGVIKIPRARYEQWAAEIAGGHRSYR